MWDSVYVERRVEPSSFLLRLRKDWGLLPSGHPFHVTVAFDSEPVDWHKPCLSPCVEPLFLSGEDMTVSRFDDKVVLEVSCANLLSRMHALRAAGLRSGCREPRPHITLGILSDVLPVLPHWISFPPGFWLGPEIRRPFNPHA